MGSSEQVDFREGGSEETYTWVIRGRADPSGEREVHVWPERREWGLPEEA